MCLHILYIKQVEKIDPVLRKQPLPVVRPCYVEYFHESYREKVWENHTKQAVTGPMPQSKFFSGEWKICCPCGKKKKKKKLMTFAQRTE